MLTPSARACDRRHDSPAEPTRNRPRPYAIWPMPWGRRGRTIRTYPPQPGASWPSTCVAPESPQQRSPPRGGGMTFPEINPDNLPPVPDDIPLTILDPDNASEAELSPTLFLINTWDESLFGADHVA